MQADPSPPGLRVPALYGRQNMSERRISLVTEASRSARPYHERTRARRASRRAEGRADSAALPRRRACRRCLHNVIINTIHDCSCTSPARSGGVLADWNCHASSPAFGIGLTATGDMIFFNENPGCGRQRSSLPALHHLSETFPMVRSSNWRMKRRLWPKLVLSRRNRRHRRTAVRSNWLLGSLAGRAGRVSGIVAPTAESRDAFWAVTRYPQKY